MTKLKPAILRSSLLVRKGHAAPATGTASHESAAAETISQHPFPQRSSKKSPAPKVHAMRFAAPAPNDEIVQADGAVDFAGIPAQTVEALRSVTKRGPTPGQHAKDAADAGDQTVSPARRPRQAAKSGGISRSALTVRLDPQRQMRLAVYSAFTQRTKQDILIEALDNYLERTCPEVCEDDCACLNKQLAAAKTLPKI